MRLITFLCIALSLALVEPTLAASTFSSAKDPFVGKWRLDVPRSTIVDDFQVKALGSNRYAFNFEGAPTETVVADGTDQPGLPGTILAVKAIDAHHLTVVRKQDGHVVLSAKWTLSPDGRTLLDDFTNAQPEGSRATTHYHYRRMAGTSGFSGVWESTTPPAGLKLELAIQPYEDKGLTFVSVGPARSVIFDGREHAASDAKDGRTVSGRRPDGRSLEYTEKFHGKVDRARRFELSRNGLTLMETFRPAGQITPTVFVFERE